MRSEERRSINFCGARDNLASSVFYTVGRHAI